LANVPGATVSGGAVALAQLDPSQVDTSRPADPDSPNGEESRSVTIRVRAVAHYEARDVAGEARRVIAITNQKNRLDKDLVSGFPLDIGASVEGSPKLADIDDDGVRDVVVPDSAGRLHVFTLRTGTPVEVRGFPYLTRPIDGLNQDLTSELSVPSYLSAPAYIAGAQGGVDPTIAREALVQSPAIADIDGDGKPEIVFASWPGTLYVINAKGQDLPGWPRRLPLIPSCPHDPNQPQPERCMDVAHQHARGALGAPVIADMNGDGKPEILLAGFDGRLWAFRADGTTLDGFPVDVAAGRIVSTPTIADLNGDGIPDIIVGATEAARPAAASAVFAIDGRGTRAPGGPLVPGWPATTPSAKLYPLLADGVTTAQAVADIDGDGRPDVVVQGNAARPLVVRDDGTEARAIDDAPIASGTLLPLLSQPSIGDIDQDGTPDIVVTGGSRDVVTGLAGSGNRLAPKHVAAVFSGKTGRLLTGAPFETGAWSFFANAALADVSGDEYPEVIIATGGYLLHAFDGCGREAPGFPKMTYGWSTPSVAVGNIDGDVERRLEIVLGTREGFLFAWNTAGHSNGPVPWESFHHDNANTGNAATKLDQGSTARARSPIDCSERVAPKPETFDVAGGCACRAGAPHRATAPRAAGAALAAALALAARLRRRSRPTARTEFSR
jgi:hypothetical protein